MRGNGDAAKIFKLYGLGRCDIGIKDSILTFRLSAAAGHSGDTRAVSGFPIELKGKTNGILQTEETKKPEAVFWTEDGHTVKSLGLNGMNISSIDLSEQSFIVSTGKLSKEGGALWALTSEGAVYLFNRNLEDLKNFPVLTGEQPSAPPSAYEDYLVFPSKSGKLCFVYFDSSVKTVDIPDAKEVKAAPSIFENFLPYM